MVDEHKSAKALVRNFHGKPAVMSGIVATPGAKIDFSVEGEHHTMTRDEWDALPVWDGPDPFGPQGVR